MDTSYKLKPITEKHKFELARISPDGSTSETAWDDEETLKCYTDVIGLTKEDAQQLMSQVKYAVQRIRYGIPEVELATMHLDYYHNFMQEMMDHVERIGRAGPVMAYSICLEILGRYIQDLCAHTNFAMYEMLHADQSIPSGKQKEYFL